MLCPSCGNETAKGASFCSNCGTRTSQSCSSCGNQLPAGAGFCDSCGTPIAGTETSTVSADQPPRPPATSSKATMYQLAETVEFLGYLSIFQNLKPELLERLARQIELTRLPEGPIFRENDPADGLYIIKSGSAKVVKSSGAGAPEGVLSTLKQGDSFGEIGLIDGLPRSADVIAMEPMECYILRRDAFLSVLKHVPEVARIMLQALARMVRNADEWVSRSI